MRIPYLSNPNEILPPSPGKPDRVSQTLFGKFGDEKRWEALDAIAVAGQSEWNQRLLLWMLANENAEMRDRCWEILDRLPLHFDLLVRELSCPMWQVRVGVMRLLVKSGRLDLIRLLIAGLEDYHPHVVEETKRSLGKLIENAQARKQRGDLPAAEVRYALEALMQPLYLSRRSPRFQAVPFLFPVALLEEDHFWSLYTELDLPQYTLLHEEFVRAQHEDALRVMYRGLLRPNEAILDRLSPFIATTVRNHRDGINQHLHVIRGFAREAFVQLAFVLQHYRILVEYQGMIKHLNPPERIVLFDLLEVVGAEQNLSFLLRCLQLDDTRIKIRVLKILGESEQLSLRHEVFEFLTDADEQVLLAALRYIQKKGDLSVLSKITHLAHSKKKKVRQGVISTMFKIMKDMLIQQFDTFSDAKREKMVEWLMKMKPTFFEDIAYLSESLKEEDRIKYLKLLGSQMLSKALEDYRRLARDPQPKIRASAIRGFARIKDDESRFKLARPFFDDEDGRVRANAIELLPEARPSQKGMIDLCRRAARSTVRREKANAIARLLNWGFSEYEAALIEMLDSEDEWTKTSGLWVLGVTDLPHLTDRLRQGANDPRAPVREMAVRGIGIKGTEEDLRALMPFLQDPSRAVRVAAQKALRTRLRLSFEIA